MFSMDSVKHKPTLASPRELCTSLLDAPPSEPCHMRALQSLRQPVHLATVRLSSFSAIDGRKRTAASLSPRNGDVFWKSARSYRVGTPWQRRPAVIWSGRGKSPGLIAQEVHHGGSRAFGKDVPRVDNP
jgi:hypothetical protein